MNARARWAAAALLCAACGTSKSGASDSGFDAGALDAGTPDAGHDGGAHDAGFDAGFDAGPLDSGFDAGQIDSGFDAGPMDSGFDAGPIDAGPPCTTTITYGSAWIHGSNHPSNVDVVSGEVTWDGTCTDSASNSFATLSNGWQPYFTGNGACVMNLQTAGCGESNACATRVTYGAAWLPPSNHPNQYDDVSGRLSWNGACSNTGSNSYTTLSNGWAPHFSGNGACEMSFRYTQCGGLYENPVMQNYCADPGVLRDADTYYMSCTSGNSANAFPIYTSNDLVNWSSTGNIFPSARKPSWAASEFWAPEIHRVGNGYVAYFAARDTNGSLSVGAASASSPLGPFTDIGAPLVQDLVNGVIDPTEFEDSAGNPYLVWKVDGNSRGNPTPIYAEALAADGLSLVGNPVQLITNDQSWEGAVTEAPFVISANGYFYLFYSGNSYANSTYALGVARSTSPLGPYTKFGPPIVTTLGQWIGPGHCSVVPGPSGDWALVYHAWLSGQVNTPGSGRWPLVDTLDWSNDWPTAYEAPTASSQPLP